MTSSQAQATSAQAASGRWTALSVLALALVLTMSPWFSATAVLPQLRALYGFGDSVGAWLTIAVQLGFVLGAVGSAASGLADRVPLRVLVIGSALAVAACNALLLVAHSPTQWLLLRVATGVFLAGVYPPAMKLVATWFVQGRGLALGVLIGAITIGSASPHLLGALGGAQWQAVIVATSAATLAGALLIAAGVREGPFPFPKAPFRLADAAATLRNRRVLLAMGGYFGHMWELYAMWAWFATYARAALAEQGSGLNAAALTFAVIASGALGCVLAGRAADRFGRARTAALAMMVSAACCVAMPWVFDGPAWLFVGVALVWGVSVIADSAQFSALVSEHADPRFVGTALTLQVGLGYVLTAATLWGLPLLARGLGSWQWTLLVLAPGPLLGIWAMAKLGAWRQAPEAPRR
ncbi:Nitrate/nitrite transporter NarK [Pseudoxanthomonas sp. GM95]|uniref:MFS transporter n=1 Tax=Pseudoxanthomonas sp. GM95 TaxID=1881043 RepID=UPI0008BCAD8C|nr:MFS transporter [Pseudoxanthomonas sp. GM95]SEL46379.1 Nitrate/nitrite transporter NarK [Pseudoxanthomonas sp. GM95]